MEPFLIGYLAKRTAKRPDGFGEASFEEIGSVSTCISTAPDYIHAWKHNALCLFNDEETAKSVIPADEAAREFDSYAFKLVLRAFDGVAERPMSMDQLPDFGMFPIVCAPLTPEYEFLGYDCVATEWNRSIAGFGCSPLSCNYMAAEIPVNRYCLIERFEDAEAAARRFAKEQPEPGVYYIVEVWRKRRDPPAT